MQTHSSGPISKNSNAIAICLLQYFGWDNPETLPVVKTVMVEIRSLRLRRDNPEALPVVKTVMV